MKLWCKLFGHDLAETISRQGVETLECRRCSQILRHRCVDGEAHPTLPGFRRVPGSNVYVALRDDWNRLVGIHDRHPTEPLVVRSYVISRIRPMDWAVHRIEYGPGVEEEAI